MLRELVLATGNQGKLAEFQKMLQDLNIQVRSMKEFPEIGEIAETGKTFAENAVIKARSVCVITGRPALADDSGLMVDALDGAPGIYSARYAEEHNDKANNAKLLENLAQVPEGKRQAAFHCAIAIAWPNGKTYVVEDSCPGVILSEAHGSGGFGYDPLFYTEVFQKTFAELTMEEKNSISHRGKANQKARMVLEKLYGEA